MRTYDFILGRITKDLSQQDFRSAVRDWFMICRQCQDVEESGSQKREKNVV